VDRAPATRACNARLQRAAASWDLPSGASIDARVENLASGAAFSVHGDDACYLASGVKLPIAVELLRQAEEGRVSPSMSVRLSASDRTDGRRATGDGRRRPRRRPTR
jgi:beta-lactamase class A